VCHGRARGSNIIGSVKFCNIHENGSLRFRSCHLPSPGAEFWRLRDPVTGRVQSCELRDDSKAGGGWKVMPLQDASCRSRAGASMNAAPALDGSR